MQLLHNYPLVAALSAIIISQVVKIPVAILLRRPSSVTLVASTGGMPSSHSAGVTSLITAFIINYGWASPYVALSILFGIIVIFDSMGVRRQSGEHGVLINELLKDFKELRLNLTSMSQEEIYELDEQERQTKEVLGHKPIEVFFGIISGVIIAILFKVLFYSS